METPTHILGRLKSIAPLAYAEKWVLLGSLAGVASALFVTGFYLLLHAVVMVSSRIIGSTYRLSPMEADLSAAALLGGYEPLLFYLTLLAGVLASSIIVYRLAPEAEGHGTDAAIAAIHKRAALIGFRIPLVKAIASAIAVGTGSSGGIEGPSVQMGAGVGSTLARLFRLSFHDRRIMATAGIAGALSAMFRAPIGAAFFSVEVLYKRDMEMQAFMPSMISSIVSYTITAPLYDYMNPLPSIPMSITAIYTPGALAHLVLLGFFVAPFSLLYVLLFTGAHRGFNRLVAERRLPQAAKPLLGALLAGVIIVMAPIAAGSGRGVLALALEGRIVEHLPRAEGMVLGILLVTVAVLKMLATSLSIGSGASGGVFAPALLAGSLLGLAYYHIVSPEGLAPQFFAYVGMAAFFGAAAKVPLATSVMVGEMGGNYLLIAPTLITALIARELVGERSIYESQLPRRPKEEAVTAELLLMLYKSARRVLVDEIVDRSYPTVKPGDTLGKALDAMARSRKGLVPVVDEEGRLVGVLEPEDIDEALSSGLGLNDPVHRARVRLAPRVPLGSTIEVAIERMIARSTDYVVVVDGGQRYVGVITVDDLNIALAFLVADRERPLGRRR